MLDDCRKLVNILLMKPAKPMRLWHDRFISADGVYWLVDDVKYIDYCLQPELVTYESLFSRFGHHENEMLINVRIRNNAIDVNAIMRIQPHQLSNCSLLASAASLLGFPVYADVVLRESFNYCINNDDYHDYYTMYHVDYLYDCVMIDINKHIFKCFLENECLVLISFDKSDGYFKIPLHDESEFIKFKNIIRYPILRRNDINSLKYSFSKHPR